MFVLWSPILGGDNKIAVDNATRYLPDPRAQHFWDTWSFGPRHYTQQLRYPENDIKETAWDIFVVYKPDAIWRSGAPEPALWMQNRDLSHGTKYSQALLEQELEKWLGQSR